MPIDSKSLPSTITQDAFSGVPIGYFRRCPRPPIFFENTPVTPWPDLERGADPRGIGHMDSITHAPRAIGGAQTQHTNIFYFLKNNEVDCAPAAIMIHI